MLRYLFVAIIVVVASLATVTAFAVADAVPEKSGIIQLDQVNNSFAALRNLRLASRNWSNSCPEPLSRCAANRRPWLRHRTMCRKDGSPGRLMARDISSFP
jgi:hypothetical protein